jgi:hypothetical protein
VPRIFDEIAEEKISPHEIKCCVLLCIRAIKPTKRLIDLTSVGANLSNPPGRSATRPLTGRRRYTSVCSAISRASLASIPR